MILNTDHYFDIGSMHLASGKPCQDYAISEILNGAALAIISDGCSTGGNTDVGARILALSTASAIREHWALAQKISDSTAHQEIIVKQRMVLAGASQILGLNTQDMLATCIYAYLSPTGGFVYVQGDGVVVLKYRSGCVIMSRFEWADNKPFYPAYFTSILPNFIQEHGGNIGDDRFFQESWIKEPGSELIDYGILPFTLSDGIRGVSVDIPESYLTDGLEFVAVFSDGITQVDSLDWKDAVLEFMAFKNTKGTFVKRRMIRGIKDARKNSKGPLDDIACAVIHIDSATEPACATDVAGREE